MEITPYDHLHYITEEGETSYLQDSEHHFGWSDLPVVHIHYRCGNETSPGRVTARAICPTGRRLMECRSYQWVRDCFPEDDARYKSLLALCRSLTQGYRVTEPDPIDPFVVSESDWMDLDWDTRPSYGWEFPTNSYKSAKLSTGTRSGSHTSSATTIFKWNDNSDDYDLIRLISNVVNGQHNQSIGKPTRDSLPNHFGILFKN